MIVHPRAAELIERLALKRHPEGGFYREVVRADDHVVHPRKGVDRSLLTCIEFLLVDDSFSALHRVRQLEVWHHLEGGALALQILDEQRQHHRTIVLGKDLAAGQVLTAAVAPDLFQAAVPLGPYALMACSVAPGFDFEDFDMPTRKELLRRFPQHEELVEELTRE